MKNLNHFQIKLLANFCSDVAKGTLLSGLGFTYALQGEIISRFIFLLISTVIALFALLFALRLANNINTDYE